MGTSPILLAIRWHYTLRSGYYIILHSSPHLYRVCTQKESFPITPRRNRCALVYISCTQRAAPLMPCRNQCVTCAKLELMVCFSQTELIPKSASLIRHVYYGKSRTPSASDETYRAAQPSPLLMAKVWNVIPPRFAVTAGPPS